MRARDRRDWRGSICYAIFMLVRYIGHTRVLFPVRWGRSRAVLESFVSVRIAFGLLICGDCCRLSFGVRAHCIEVFTGR